MGQSFGSSRTPAASNSILVDSPTLVLGFRPVHSSLNTRTHQWTRAPVNGWSSDDPNVRQMHFQCCSCTASSRLLSCLPVWLPPSPSLARQGVQQRRVRSREHTSGVVASAERQLLFGRPTDRSGRTAGRFLSIGTNELEVRLPACWLQ